MSHFPPEGTSRPPRGPTYAIWKESSKRLQSYGPDKNITLIPWGTRSWGQMSHFPRKAHLDPLGVLHVQYEKNPPSGYGVMARTRILTWENKHITLTPWGSSFSGSNVSQPTKGTSTPPGGPTCAIWKESSMRLQSYEPDKNITLTPWGTRSWSQMSHFPMKGTSRPPRGPKCAICKESS